MVKQYLSDEKMSKLIFGFLLDLHSYAKESTTYCSECSDLTDRVKTDLLQFACHIITFDMYKKLEEQLKNYETD